jgi:hypothetical protein
MTRATGLFATLAALALAAPARAQDSQFGLHGLGTPGRWESVRARSTGGAFAPFDAFSPLLEASIADVRRVSASATGGESWRTLDFGSESASLRATRFPSFMIVGPISRGLVLSGGFATYLDKTFGITTRDTIDIRGNPEPVTDAVTSDGAVADLRVALAARVHNRLQLGVALHGLTGSTRVKATRRFDDTTTYRTSTATDEIAYHGLGGSASALLNLTGALRLAAWARSDKHLRAEIRGRIVGDDDLPFAYGGGVQWRPGTQAAVAGAVAWRRWGGAGLNAHDTFDWSVGTELGSPASPIRFGVRGGQLAFGPGPKAPTEFGVSGGLGKQFSGGRGRLDFGLERLQRKGPGLTEHVWTFLLGLTVRP